MTAKKRFFAYRVIRLTQKQREKQMKRTLVVGLLLFLCLGVAESTPRAAKEIIGVSQTWTYDAATHIGTLRFVNTSHKPITAYNVSVYLTEPDRSEFLSGSKFMPMNDPPFMPAGLVRDCGH